MLALPFHLMITYTGIITLIFMLFPTLRKRLMMTVCVAF
ncbi:hypothetical protein P4S63_19730 [Pseudoalteromonas sp. B193]